MKVDSDHRTTCNRGDPQHRASRPTSNVEQRLPNRNFQPLQKPVLLLCGVPTILSDILAKGLYADLCIQCLLKMYVVDVVVPRRRGRIGFSHLDLCTNRALMFPASNARRILPSLRINWSMNRPVLRYLLQGFIRPEIISWFVQEQSCVCGEIVVWRA